MNFFGTQKMRSAALTTYFIIFFCSGFSGLIYESIWSHYLKLFLGHAAYAQTLVLTIFMGGMGIGAYIAGRLSVKRKNLLLLYGLIEGIVGLFGILFHEYFVFSTDFALNVLIPFVETPIYVSIIKWGMGAALILPQSILLGATFPLMTAGIIRKFPLSPGKNIAGLYFVNSLGAAIGVLCNGFILIRIVGLPGAVLAAGLINVFLALLVWMMSRKDSYDYVPDYARENKISATPFFLLFLAAGTGAASFIYEIGWIRMLSMVLGSSTHSFELMLSAFILGLAIGGLLIRRYISSLKDSARFLGYVQIFMGILAILTLVIYNSIFNVMSVLLKTLSVSLQGYYFFNLFSYGISLLVMLPATICAGMTLPLLTKLLLEREGSDSAIGKIYSANTFGSILGVLLAVHFFMPFFGLKVLMLVGGAIDIGLGISLLRPQRFLAIQTKEAMVTLLGIIVIFFVTFFIKLDSLKMASGVYRYGILQNPKNANVLFHRDGKTATVDLVEYTESRVISTNGKPDASIAINMSVTDATIPPTSDESTMVLAAAIPLSIKPELRRVANIGIGSGLTSHVMLTVPTIETVDTIEIESRMAEAARLFGGRVANTFKDNRSHIYFDDAKSFFAATKNTYDLIISEPSNPWVSGTSSLFTEEFYHRIVQNLESDGLFAQWVQGYEINKGLIASIYKAMSPAFEDIHLYNVASSDFLFIARKEGKLTLPKASVFDFEKLSAELRFIGIRNRNDLLARWVARKEKLDRFFGVMDQPVNSDYFPFVDLNAARERFLRHSAIDLEDLRIIPLLPNLALDNITPKSLLAESQNFLFASQYNMGMQFIARVSQDREGERQTGIKSRSSVAAANLFDDFFCSCRCDRPSTALHSVKYLSILQKMIPVFSSSQLKEFTEFVAKEPCFSVFNTDMQQLTAILHSASLENYVQAAIAMKILLADRKLADNSESLFFIKLAFALYVASEDYYSARELVTRLADVQVKKDTVLDYFIALVQTSSAENFPRAR